MQIKDYTKVVNKFITYLNNLGFSDNELKARTGTVFSYKLGLSKIVYFVYTPDNKAVFNSHHEFWNENSLSAFIAVGSEKTYIINTKRKPNKDNPTSKQVVIKSFNYGVNSKGFDKEKVKEITKDYIDSTYFFDFIIKLTANKKKQEVDKHLLLNLIALRNDLSV